MELKQLLEAVDTQVLSGDIIGAFDQFAADHCVTLSNAQDKTHSKAQKIEALRWFFDNVASINRIERPASLIHQNTTESEFLFDFTARSGNPMVYTEVIRRTWENGQIVEEQYLIGQSLDQSEPTPDAASEVQPAANETPAKAKKTTKKSNENTTDNLVIIEGIGPKIAELLNKAGINSFAELADSKPTAIKDILEAAGKRYQIHDPATWPQQAALARDGKTAELKALQEDLKGGRK
jgi:predicted flap endonuclease-1-like 5' DNA nuclease